MQDLLQQLVSKTGISEQQAKGVLQTIQLHLNEYYPAFATQFPSLFNAPASATGNNETSESFVQQAADFTKEKKVEQKNRAGKSFPGTGNRVRELL